MSVRLHQKGDTIVEVLIALAILSLAFVISYSTASAALLNSQNSQEHSMALEYLDTQIELLRYVANQPYQTTIASTDFSSGTGKAFCLYVTNTNVMAATFGTSLAYQYQSSIKPTDYPPQCQIGSGFSYYVAIQPGPAPNDFQIWLWWYGLGNLGIQQERLSYRVYQQ